MDKSDLSRGTQEILKKISGDKDEIGQRTVFQRQRSERELERQLQQAERQQVRSQQYQRQSLFSSEVSTDTAALLSGSKVFDPSVCHF